MARMSLDLSDGLAELRRQFNDYTHEPRVLAPSDARTLQEICDVLYARARELENEVSAKRWNEAARLDQRDSDRVLAALQAPDTNIRLFPVIPRPFSDGHPQWPGGAA